VLLNGIMTKANRIATAWSGHTASQLVAAAQRQSPPHPTDAPPPSGARYRRRPSLCSRHPPPRSMQRMLCGRPATGCCRGRKNTMATCIVTALRAAARSRGGALLRRARTGHGWRGACADSAGPPRGAERYDGAGSDHVGPGRFRMVLLGGGGAEQGSMCLLARMMDKVRATWPAAASPQRQQRLEKAFSHSPVSAISAGREYPLPPLA
jgi:hypothetical protein